MYELANDIKVENQAPPLELSNDRCDLKFFIPIETGTLEIAMYIAFEPKNNQGKNKKFECVIIQYMKAVELII